MLSSGLPFSNLSIAAMVPVLACACVFATPAGAVKANLPKYPLHVHVLASDETHRSPRMNPGDSLMCDGIEDMASSLSGTRSDPCSEHPELIMGRFLDAQDWDPVFSGEGRGDLVSPPKTTQGFTFRYDNCSRVRVRPGFSSLPARWKKPGKTLEVLVPSDDIPANGKPLQPVKCTFSVTMHDFVYLLLRNGRMVQVSQDAYWQKPALRVFLSGTTVAVQQRPKQFTVSAHPAAASTTTTTH
jgi:hypothetical protein